MTTLASTLPTRTGSSPWIGTVLRALAMLFLFADATSTLLAIPPVLSAAAAIGFPTTPGLWHVLGAVLMLATVLYAIPRTSFIGAVIVTGYLGGAICAHVRIGEDVFAPALICLLVATSAWGGLLLREERLRDVVLGR